MVLAKHGVSLAVKPRVMAELDRRGTVERVQQ
jgi:hypothetical protein